MSSVNARKSSSSTTRVSRDPAPKKAGDIYGNFGNMSHQSKACQSVSLLLAISEEELERDMVARLVGNTAPWSDGLGPWMPYDEPTFRSISSGVVQPAASLGRVGGRPAGASHSLTGVRASAACHSGSRSQVGGCVVPRGRAASACRSTGIRAAAGRPEESLVEFVKTPNTCSSNNNCSTSPKPPAAKGSNRARVVYGTQRAAHGRDRLTDHNSYWRQSTWF